MPTRLAGLVRILVLLGFSLILIAPVWTADSEHFLSVDATDPAALQEATRILAEEIKLAARPQTYIIIDLVDRAVVIKGRGAELHRLPIEQWSGLRLDEASAAFRLQARPPVVRRKIEPTAAAEQPPVSLDDMPTDFTLTFVPAFSLAVHPSASHDFWRWLRFAVRDWWTWLKDWSRRLLTGKDAPTNPALRVTLTPHHAQSLAWTVTEGMPFLVRRPPG